MINERKDIQRQAIISNINKSENKQLQKVLQTQMLSCTNQKPIRSTYMSKYTRTKEATTTVVQTDKTRHNYSQNIRIDHRLIRK